MAQNQTDPDQSSVESCTKNAKRRLRRPLRDITHLFNSPIQSASAPITQLHLSFPVPALASNLRKRKATDEIDSTQLANSKSLRKNFR
ncbi:hypothetical protein Acr_00g0035810 [Actinidia rufa]|uniref:Uncharacterized protein n=1 Tax=Actinidia rufa TaxID=165716 RepID=A0A7J0DGC1_9ERIC|nr:hypothetical protein Acr_00g0035810 [Actinidia rufa]